MEWPPSTPMRLPIFPWLKASSIPVMTEFHFYTSCVRFVKLRLYSHTLCGCNELESSWICLHHSMHDINLFPCLGDGVFVLGCATNISRPKLLSLIKENHKRPCETKNLPFFEEITWAPTLPVRSLLMSVCDDEELAHGSDVVKSVISKSPTWFLARSRRVIGKSLCLS